MSRKRKAAKRRINMYQIVALHLLLYIAGVAVLLITNAAQVTRRCGVRYLLTALFIVANIPTREGL